MAGESERAALPPGTDLLIRYFSALEFVFPRRTPRREDSSAGESVVTAML